MGSMISIFGPLPSSTKFGCSIEYQIRNQGFLQWEYSPQFDVSNCVDQFVVKNPGRLPSGFGRERHNNRFHCGTIYNDAASGLIWVENQVSLGANKTIVGKARFEQWLWGQAVAEVSHYHSDCGREQHNNRFHGGTIDNDAASGLIWVENQVLLGANETIVGKAWFEQWLWGQAVAEVSHYHSDNGILVKVSYCKDCEGKGQTMSFSGVGAQHQNSRAERAIQTTMYMARTFRIPSSLSF